MIFSNLNGFDRLTDYPFALQRALNYLMTTDISGLTPGKYPIDGEEMFAVVSELELKPDEDVPSERHCRYIDVQYWPEIGERFGIAPYLGTEVPDQAHEDSDVWYYTHLENESFIQTRKGDFAVFFPWDLHRPGLQTGQKAVIHKCVVKVSMDLLGEC